MLSPRKAAFGLVVLLCAGNLWTSLVRSGIPLAMNGTVTSLEVRPEKHPGVDDVHLVGVGDRILHLDKSLAQRLAVGETLHKSRWSMIVKVSGDPVKIDPSRDFYGMIFTMALLISTAWFLTTSREMDRLISSGS